MGPASRIRCERALDGYPELDDGHVVSAQSCSDGSKLHKLPRTFTAGGLSDSDAVPDTCSCVTPGDSTKELSAAANDFSAPSVTGRTTDPVESIGNETKSEPVSAGDHAV